mmetsp:Transcript_15722/g.17437  ORF Transcript_15722/g.17437 Transcript_15722/m.17437 type:complete len:208 (+) Transcript_15722:3-626(+)
MIKSLCIALLISCAFSTVINITDSASNYFIGSNNGYDISLELFSVDNFKTKKTQTLVCVSTDSEFFIDAGNTAFGFQVTCNSAPGLNCTSKDQFDFKFMSSFMYSHQPPVWYGDGNNFAEFGTIWPNSTLEHPNVNYHLNQTLFELSKFPHGKSVQSFVCFSDASSYNTIGDLKESQFLHGGACETFEIKTGPNFDLKTKLGEMISS